MTISNELLDELLKGCKRPEDLLGDAGLMKELITLFAVAAPHCRQTALRTYQTLPLRRQRDVLRVRYSHESFPFDRNENK
ncbi:hypothetical protein [Paracoccus mutanolyticus]|uniref:hypothetical protein n=1 Tax=Paracoccus mutanolyticus TaxID=1499308 RepID=UPI0011AE6451|nr:hypothetical protein [Paracoccus mutanolyticus]